jgi:hypothetical protein
MSPDESQNLSAVMNGRVVISEGLFGSYSSFGVGIQPGGETVVVGGG